MVKKPEKWKQILDFIEDGKSNEQIQGLTGENRYTIERIRRNKELYKQRIEEAENPMCWPFEDRFSWEWTRAVNKLRAAAGKPLFEEHKRIYR